jgi:cytohesin
MCGKVDFIELLLDHGANVDWKSLTDVTPAHVAAQCGQCAALEIMVRRGADVYAATNDSATTLHWAARFNQYYTVEVVVRLGADVNAVDSDGVTAFNHAANSIVYCERYPDQNYEQIARGQGVDLAWVHVRNGADIKRKNMHGWTTMYMARSRGSVQMARVLPVVGHGRIHTLRVVGWSFLGTWIGFMIRRNRGSSGSLEYCYPRTWGDEL